MGKIVTILGGCLVAAGGVGYGVYTHHHGCPLASGCGAKVSAPAPCCAESDACPLAAVGTSAEDEGGCPLAAAKATSLTSASADGEECCPATAAKCPAAAGTGLQAVAGAALSAGGK